MVFKVGHGEVKGNFFTRRGRLSWVLEIKKCCPMTCQWSFSPCAHVIMAFVDSQTRRFSKDIVTFTLRFLYSPRKGPLSWDPQVKLWELPALTSGPCDITAAPRCGSCPWRRHRSPMHPWAAGHPGLSQLLQARGWSVQRPGRRLQGEVTRAGAQSTLTAALVEGQLQEGSRRPAFAEGPLQFALK